jgi:hypothetical protein
MEFTNACVANEHDPGGPHPGRSRYAL